jgi:hypothetical protein
VVPVLGVRVLPVAIRKSGAWQAGMRVFHSRKGKPFT